MEDGNCVCVFVFCSCFRTADDLFPSTSYTAMTKEFSNEDLSTFAKNLKEKNQ